MREQPNLENIHLPPVLEKVSDEMIHKIKELPLEHLETGTFHNTEQQGVLVTVQISPDAIAHNTVENIVAELSEQYGGVTFQIHTEEDADFVETFHILIYQQRTQLH